MKHNGYFCAICALLVLLSSACIDREAPVDKKKLLGDDFRLFQGTIAWDLAKAVQDQDISRIKYEVETLGIPVDYKEKEFGGTLLMLAVRSNKKESVKALLELGASPNEPNDTIRNFGRNAVIFASRFSRPSPEILKMLLEYGGNPNSIERGVQQDNLGNWVPARHFALYDAISSEGDFEKVRILVEAGADVNMQTEDTGESATIYCTYLVGRMDVMLYLLEHGANYNGKFEMTNCDPPSYTTFYVDILYILRLCIYPLNSKQYKDKLKVIDFLKKKGMDYWKSPIPNDAIEIIKRDIAPKNVEELQEYLKKY